MSARRYAFAEPTSQTLRGRSTHTTPASPGYGCSNGDAGRNTQPVVMWIQRTIDIKGDNNAVPFGYYLPSRDPPHFRLLSRRGWCACLLQVLRDFRHYNSNTAPNRILDDAPVLSIIRNEMSHRATLAALIYQKIAFLNEMRKRNLQTFSLKARC
jgi:hypothetical protein